MSDSSLMVLSYLIKSCSIDEINSVIKVCLCFFIEGIFNLGPNERIYLISLRILYWVWILNQCFQSLSTMFFESINKEECVNYLFYYSFCF